jgi:L-alanine-DL-glutamate epimerase-like enolase superfamily enzyme
VDIALWDIKGKALKAPLYQLLGGKHRSKLRAYASLLSSPKPGYDPTADAMRYVEEGYTAVKFKVWREEEVKFIKSVRRAVGNSVDLLVDANCHYTRSLAYRVARECERYDVFWLEEPYYPDELESIAELAASTDVNIAGAENDQTRYRFREIITRHAMDIIMPDTCICGGISETMKIAAMASAHHMPCDLHLAYRPTMEGVHVSAAIPNSIYVENVMTFSEPIISTNLIAGYKRVEKGYVELPSKPGLGVELNEKAAAKYAVPL